MNENIEKIKKILNKDNRSSERLSLNLQTEFKFSSLDSWFKPLEVNNVSGGGICLTHTRRVQENRNVTLRIKLPYLKKPVIIKGTTKWCKRFSAHSGDGSQKLRPFYSLGIEFEKAEHQEKKEFILYLTQNIVNSFLDETGHLKQ
ncbi:MAG: PilZ domain-containing protein [Candidatus Omnitrophica bacterium]|nr:PilZ domain-containing protein [Candidatus Omnitrophota bacterium]